MTSPLEEVSYKLGELSAGVAILTARAEKRDGQMNEFGEKLTKLTSLLEPVVEDHKFMKPQVRHYAGVRRNVVWLGSVIVTFGGFAGGLLGNWLIKKYS